MPTEDSGKFIHTFSSYPILAEPDSEMCLFLLALICLIYRCLTEQIHATKFTSETLYFRYKLASKLTFLVVFKIFSDSRKGPRYYRGSDASSEVWTAATYRIVREYCENESKGKQI